MLNSKIRTQQESPEGRLMFCLVREFLEYFNLDFTILVFEPESYLGSGYSYAGRHQTAEDLGIAQTNGTSEGPLLLQLLKTARMPSKTIDINLNTVQETSCGSDFESQTIDTENQKTNDSPCPERLDKKPDLEDNLNSTFDVRSPVYELFRKKTAEKVEVNTKVFEVERSNLSDISEDGLQLKDNLESDFSPPIVKDSKTQAGTEKTKISPPKSDKLKGKSSLSSLADLPPLPLNKTRTDSVLLPSLYSKEFKEKSNLNLKEIDKCFDVDSDSLDNYEEDFVCGSDADLRLNLPDESCSSASSDSTRSMSPRGKDSKSVTGLRKPTLSPSTNIKLSPILNISSKQHSETGIKENSPQKSDEEDGASIAEDLSKLSSTVSSVSSDDFQLNT